MKSLKEIAKEVRTALKKAYPKCKFSVTQSGFSGGQELSISLMKAPKSPFANLNTTTEHTHEGDYAQLNHIHIKQDWDGNWISNGYYLTPEAAEMLKKVTEIAQSDNWNNSDLMTDYFDVNYWFHLNIGKWNRAFVTS